MDIVIDIQGFRNAKEKFLPKEVALVAINAPIVGHWIMMPPHPFGELPESSRRQNNWLSRCYHGIEWFDGETNLRYFTLQLREIVRQARYIYSRGQEKAHYLQCLLSRNVYNLEGISPPFRNLFDGEENRCTHHGFQSNTKFHCALRNAYKLKHWLVKQNSSECSDSTCDNLSLSTESESDEDDVGEKIRRGIFVKNLNFDTIHNIGAWRKNNAIEENKLAAAVEQARGDQSPVREKEEELPKIESCINKDKIIVSGTSGKQSYIDDNSTLHSVLHDTTGRTTSASVTKEVESGFIQIIPPVRAPTKNELARNFTSLASTQCQICGSLSCRQAAEGVDEVDRHRR